MTDLAHLRLFVTHPHPCSYIEGEEATTLFVDPTALIDESLYTRLSEVGFRRSGSHLYRPRCASCQACVPARIPVQRFVAKRNQKRCLTRNSDLEVNTVSSIASDEHFELYERYINTRHADGDMFPPSQEQYDSFLTSDWGTTEHLEFRLGGRLLGVAVCDKMENALSAVYTFFEPEADKRSLGVFAILQQIALAQSLGLPYLYLGYWIKQCDKMRYKTQYRPLEVFVNQRWALLR